MFKNIAFIILFILPFVGISQSFTITTTDATPCQGDTIRISHADGLPTTWNIEQTAFEVIGALSGTSTFQLVCNTPGTFNISGNDGAASGTLSLNVYGVDAGFDLIPNSLNSYKINVKSTEQPAPYSLPYTFTWSFDDGTITTDNITEANLDEIYFASTSHLYADSGIYNISLEVTNGLGCKATTTIIDTISNVFSAPNFITPNGDGKNDFFTARTNGNILFSMVIYSRWGNVVFESEKPSTTVAWDGRLKGGGQASSGVYFYTITPEDETNQEKLTGFFHLFLEK